MKNVFPTSYEEFIFKRTYARFIHESGRREEFPETISRYRNFFLPRVPKEMEEIFDEAISEISRLGIVPSMRCLWAAGESLERENIAGYNCAFAAIDHPRVFAEILYVLMNGTGMGFSVERQNVAKLPEIPKVFREGSIHIVFADSKMGWAAGYEEFIDALFAGYIPTYDLSQIRPKGSILKTFGGRASGPEPLEDLLQFTLAMFVKAAGRKFSSIEAHDIVCKIANCVVVGGVRRSAGISLSNLSDDRMRHAKDGDFWTLEPQRALSNNSAVYSEKPDAALFMDEWLALMRSGNGERGIVNRESLQRSAAANGRDSSIEYGVNPCGEIILRPYQCCNLTEVIVHPDDTLACLMRKVRLCTILGMMQSTLTDFQFLRPIWKENCEAERLLGVSLTGTSDHPVLREYKLTTTNWLAAMKQVAADTVAEYAPILGISVPAAVTCVKPSGTVSQLVNSASGLHTRHSSYYIRRVRVTATDPMASFLMAKGVPCDPEVGETWDNPSTLVFAFPVKAPAGAITREDRSAIEQLDYWLMYKTYWCDHNPSVTISVKDDEWLEVGAWVFKNWEHVGGLSFLPYAGGVYPLMPYTECTEEDYLDACAEFPQDIDFSELAEFEQTDETIGSAEMACSGGSCELR